MTDLVITIDIAAAEALLKHIADKADHLQPTLKAIGDVINQRVRLTFRDLQSPEGVAWKPLSPVTKFNRAARVAGGKVYIKSGKRTTKKFTDAYLTATPLNDTGVLRNSIAYQLSGEAVEIGTNAKQAAMMNFGGTKAQFGHLWDDIPARPFMPANGLPVAWESEVIDVIKDHLGVM